MKYQQHLTMLLALSLLTASCNNAADDAQEAAGNAVDDGRVTGSTNDPTTASDGVAGTADSSRVAERRDARRAAGGAVEYTQKAMRDAGKQSVSAASWQQTRGNVAFQGKPVGRAEVVFYSKSSPFNRIAHTDDQGQFVCRTHLGKGLPEGEYQVIVRPIFVDPVLSGKWDPNDPIPPMSRKDIPRKYQQRKTSTLSYKIVAGKNDLNIVLQGGR